MLRMCFGFKWRRWICEVVGIRFLAIIFPLNYKAFSDVPLFGHFYGNGKQSIIFQYTRLETHILIKKHSVSKFIIIWHGNVDLHVINYADKKHRCKSSPCKWKSICASTKQETCFQFK